MNQRPILVIGGTGKTGRRIIQLLKTQGIETRTGSRKAPLPFEWNDPSTWPAVLKGCSAIYIAYYPDLAVPGAVATVEQLVDMAKAAGVQKFVLLSGRGEEEAQSAERMLQGKQVDWTILRASWFAQNFSEHFLLDAILSGTVALPVGNVLEPFVHADDIAEVALQALTQDGHEQKLYELTGPRLMTFAQAVQEIATATHRPIDFIEIPAEAYAAAMQQQNVPEEMVKLVMYLFTNVLDGRNSQLAEGVQQALNRAPRDFAQYVTETAQTPAWTPQPA